ncbi:hypothetical protein DACRYDRAFT_21568 [Dacryopinax primogenitus]|uniref:Uncharacterized protein n=1 Tax=Dacryopinax primogenitus (strain DJM 731) TaxID=1858805 RepID=M5GEM3_DACPD|nr:uncharacterized protein DACRYDRAFT_21568 [Dacryopinax primogenitus]EJU03393.1 hypothetical protein DACRYDRAFT_21568 [Dacryopinax primogenitus]
MTSTPDLSTSKHTRSNSQVWHDRTVYKEGATIRVWMRDQNGHTNRDLGTKFRCMLLLR